MRLTLAVLLVVLFGHTLAFRPPVLATAPGLSLRMQVHSESPQISLIPFLLL